MNHVQRFNEYNFQGFNGCSDEEIKILENYLSKGKIDNPIDAKFILNELESNQEFYQDFINSSKTYYSWYIWISFIICISFYAAEIYFFFFVRSLENLAIMLGLALIFPSLANPVSESLSQKINFYWEFKKLKKPLENYLAQNKDNPYSLEKENSLKATQIYANINEKGNEDLLDYRYQELIAFYEKVRLNWSHYDLKRKRDSLEKLFLIIKFLKEDEEKYLETENKLILKKTN